MEKQNEVIRLQSIQIGHFRCFKNLELQFSKDHNFHVILGNNMTGKTAIIDALSTCLSLFTVGMAIPNTQAFKGIKHSDHRLLDGNSFTDRARLCLIDLHIQYQYEYTESNIKNLVLTVESVWPQQKSSYPSVLSEEEYQARKDNPKNKAYSVGDFTNRRELWANFNRHFLNLINQNIDRAKEEKVGVLPMFCLIPTYYLFASDSIDAPIDSTDDQLDQTYDFSEEDIELLKDFTENGYLGWYRNKSVKNFIFRWLAAKYDTLNAQGNSEILKKFNGPTAEISRELIIQNIRTILPELLGTEWNNDPLTLDFVFLIENETSPRPFEMLSDGYRYLILMIMELTVRAILLNKHLQLDACKLAEGVVLIDEFGVHLHPELQRVVLGRLKSIFPNLQFIITTHSPMLLNGLKKEQIWILEADEKGNRTVRNPERDVVGIGAEGILREMFGLNTTMDEETLNRLKRFRHLKRKGLETNEAEESELAELYEKVGSLGYSGGTQDPVYQMFLRKVDTYFKKDSAEVNIENLDLKELEKVMDEAIIEAFGINSDEKPV